MKTVKYTKEDLIEFGMREETDGLEKVLFPMKKVISVEQESSGDEMAICITSQRNVHEICLILPDGGCLYLSPESMDELKIFEKCITSYESNY